MTQKITQYIKVLNTNAALLGAVLMVIAGLIFAVINTLLQSLTMQFGQASASVVFWQYWIALLLSLPWILRKLAAAKTSNLPLHILRVFFAAVGVQLWVVGLSYVPIWQAIALIMTAPFFVTAGAHLVLREKVGLERWLAVGFGFLGGMIILSPWSDEFGIETLYPLAASFFWAMSSLTTKRLAWVEKPQTLTFYLLVLLTPINAILAFESGFVISEPTAIWMVVVAGILTALAQYALAKAYTVADAAYLQPFDHLKLPMNVLLGWLVFGFLPVGSMWLGSLIIIAASSYLLNAEMKRPAKVAVAAA
jgi:S-adenosylmethionine uptake transporter